MAVFSTGERKKRPRGDRKSQEMSIHLRQTFEAAIKTELYPRSQIDIFVEVLQGIFISCIVNKIFTLRCIFCKICLVVCKLNFLF